jgi:hypothetical protein
MEDSMGLLKLILSAKGIPSFCDTDNVGVNFFNPFTWITLKQYLSSVG